MVTHKTQRYFQGSKHCTRDERLRLDTPDWDVRDYEGDVMSPAEVERHWEKIMRAPLVVRDREYPFSEDVIVDGTGAVDTNLGPWRMFSLSLKRCVCVEVMSWCTSSGQISLCLPSV